MPLTARAETSIMPERAPAERGTAPAGLGLGQGLAAGQRQRVYLDLTHLGRHVTGIERVTIEQFEKVAFEGADVHHVRSKGVLTMILAQQLWLPLLALLHPRAIFVFPGFPPSPFFRLVRERVVMYVHDLFLLTRRQDLGRKAKLYMAWPFGVAVKGLKHFLVNSEKTRAELEPFVSADADIGLYRPAVRNVFALSAEGRTGRSEAPRPLRIVALGTVEPRKNLAAAATITEELAALLPGGAELHIAGREGWGEERLRLAGRPHVTLHGYLPAAEVKSLAESADIYLCTSHDEGLGLPLLEAQYAGLPIVAPDQTVFHEVLGPSGTFIDPAKPADAANTIAALVAKPGWRSAASALATANVAHWNEQAAEDARRARALFTRPLGSAVGET